MVELADITTPLIAHEILSVCTLSIPASKITKAGDEKTQYYRLRLRRNELAQPVKLVLRYLCPTIGKSLSS